MNGKLLHGFIALVVFAGLSAAFVGLTWQPPASAETVVEHEVGDECCPPGEVHPDAAATHEDEHELEDGHDHAGHEALGALSLDELRQTHCEHEVSIVECDECRYEAGVAKIAPELAQGLVETWPVRTEARATKRLTLTGEVQLDRTRVVEIASVGAGRVEQVHKNLGDTVAEGEVVAVVQSSEFGEAQAAFLEARARLELARQTFEREKQLHERKVSSEADYLNARSELASAEASVAAARKRLGLFGLGDDRVEELSTPDAQTAFGQLVLSSPLAGTVIEQDAVRGQIVDPSDRLYRVADLSHVWVWCDLYESDLGTLHERMASGGRVEAEVQSGAFPQTAFRGTVDMIGSQLDRETRTVKVRVAVDNPDGRLRPGMFVRVMIGLDDERAVLRVPAAAVLSDGGEQFVFAKLSDDLWIRRDVTAGPVEGGMVEVREGLQEGDIVAAKGAFMFKSEVLKEKMGAGCAH